MYNTRATTIVLYKRGQFLGLFLGFLCLPVAALCSTGLFVQVKSGSMDRGRGGGSPTSQPAGRLTLHITRFIQSDSFTYLQHHTTADLPPQPTKNHHISDNWSIKGSNPLGFSKRLPYLRFLASLLLDR